MEKKEIAIQFVEEVKIYESVEEIARDCEVEAVEEKDGDYIMWDDRERASHTSSRLEAMAHYASIDEGKCGNGDVIYVDLTREDLAEHFNEIFREELAFDGGELTQCVADYWIEALRAIRPYLPE
jgi:hypothetical protein